ncbi:hypothetical protein DMC61_37785 [Amycolatopsis sp. WAC 04169]|nr:hypothetical protein DMC61_37785 [Amycolatopsis sp. WAC 04169]
MGAGCGSGECGQGGGEAGGEGGRGRCGWRGGGGGGAEAGDPGFGGGVGACVVWSRSGGGGVHHRSGDQLGDRVAARESVVGDAGGVVGIRRRP